MVVCGTLLRLCFLVTFLVGLVQLRFSRVMRSCEAAWSCRRGGRRTQRIISCHWVHLIS